jgi:uncharacterized protein (DUF433 family)
MTLRDRITIEAGKCGGRPCTRGMRIRVSDLLDMLAGGATAEEILESFPYLELTTSPPLSLTPQRR